VVPLSVDKLVGGAIPIGRFVGGAIANRGCEFAMALTEITNMVGNDPPYNLQVSLDSRYAPLCKKGRFIHEQIFKKSDFSTCRSRGSTNIDLWVDGSIYPIILQIPRLDLHHRLGVQSSVLNLSTKGKMGCLDTLRISLIWLEILVEGP
jgi:hypothetical protein